MLSSYAHLIYEIRVEEPNFYTVVFPQDCHLQCEYCEKNKAEILQRISSQIKHVPQLRFTIDPSATAPQTPVFKESVSLLTSNNTVESVEKKFHNFFPDSIPSPKAPEGTSSKTDVVNSKNLKDQVESNTVAKSLQDIFEAELSEVLLPLIPEKKHSIFGN